MRFLWGLLTAGYLWVQCQALSEEQLWERTTSTLAPECALICLATLIPQYCGSLTNATCICTDTTLAAALTPCAVSACNVTESLQLERYSMDSCGVVNDKTRQQQQLSMYFVLPALVTIFVALRLFSRVQLEIGLGADDWMIIAAGFAFMIDTGVGIGIVVNGFGQHTYYLSIYQVSQALKLFYIAELFYVLTITLTKLSLLLFFRRIFPNQGFRMGVWIFGGFIVLSNFSILMALTFQCVPFHGNWTNWMYQVAPVKCIDSFVAIYMAAGLSIFHDIVILVMPIPILWSLNLGWQKKLNLLIMFSVGSFVIICSLLRLPTLKKMVQTSDPSYDQAPVAVWTNLEVSVGLICACLPACRSLVGYIFPSLKMSIGSSSGRDTPAAFVDRSASNVKLSRKRMDSSTRSFIELDEHTSSNEENKSRRTSVGTHGSQVPITEKLNPGYAKGYGVQTTVDVREMDDQTRPENGYRSSGILMTHTVDVQRHSDHGLLNRY